MPAEPIPPEDRKLFEEKGEDYVRRTWGGEARHPAAKAWLAEIDKTRRKADEARQAELMLVSKSTLKAAWIAAYGSIGAVLVGVIGILIAVLLWRFPRH